MAQPRPILSWCCRCLAAGAIGLSLTSGVRAGPDSSGRTTPLSYGMSRFAGPLLEGPAPGHVHHLWFEGDSISSPLSPRYEQGVVKTWPIGWTGWVTAGSEPFSPSNCGGSPASTYRNDEYDWYGGVNASFPYGGTTIAPGTQNHYTWQGDDPGRCLLRITFLREYSGAWANGVDWTSNAALMFKWNLWGTPSTIARVRVRGRRDNDLNIVDLRNQDLRGQDSIVSVTTPIPVFANSEAVVAPDLLTEPGYDETGRELILLPGVIYRCDAAGQRVPGTWFSAQASHGGYDALMHIDQRRCTDQRRRDFYVAQGALPGDTVLFVIQLGTNNPLNRDGFQYAQDVLAVVQNRRQICSALGVDCRFLLVSPYDTTDGAPFQSDLSTGLYQLALSNGDIAFYDLFAAAGSHQMLSAQYLADGVHPNAAGAVYFMGLVWGAIAGAAPTGCWANCDGSTAAPVLNVLDFTCFMRRFSAGDAYANCDGSTQPPVLSFADFSCFLQKFAAGCP